MTDHNALIDELAGAAAPVRPRSTATGQVTFAGVAILTLVTVTLAFGSRPDLTPGRIPPMIGLTAGLLLIVAAAAGAGAVRMARPQVGAHGSGAPWALAALMLLPAISLAGIAAQPDSATGLALDGGVRCLLFGLGAGLASLAFLVGWLRRGAPVAPERASWLAGLAAGAIGALAVTLECRQDSLAHVGMWHVAVPLVAAGAARMTLPWLLRW